MWNLGQEPVKTTLISAQELDSALLGQWHAWQEAAGVSLNPFLSPTFAEIYGRHQKRARIALIEDDGELVGFLPLEQTAFGAARFLGNGLCDMQTPTFKPGYVPHSTALMTALGISVFEFDRMLPEMAEQLDPNSSRMVASPVIDITCGYEDWLAEKRKSSSKRFRRILQYQRQIGREIGDIEFDFASTSHADLDMLMSWKSAQYVRTGRRDRFAKTWFRDVMHDLLDRTDDNYGMVLSKLSAGGNVLAFDLALKNTSTLAGWFPAYDVAYSKYSPGTVCMLQQIEYAAKNDFTRIDLGVGEASYKESFKNYDDYVVEGWCERKTPAALLYRASNMPERMATDFVLSRPRLRLAARRTLSTIGSVRHRAMSNGSTVTARIPQFVAGGSVAAAEWSSTINLLPAF